MKVSLASGSGMISRSLGAKTFQRGANRLPISLGLADRDIGTGICKMGFQLRKEYHHPCTGPQSVDIWLLFRIRVWRIGNLFCNEF